MTCLDPCLFLPSGYHEHNMQQKLENTTVCNSSYAGKWRKRQETHPAGTPTAEVQI